MRIGSESDSSSGVMYVRPPATAAAEPAKAAPIRKKRIAPTRIAPTSSTGAMRAMRLMTAGPSRRLCRRPEAPKGRAPPREVVPHVDPDEDEDDEGEHAEVDGDQLDRVAVAEEERSLADRRHRNRRLRQIILLGQLLDLEELDDRKPPLGHAVDHATHRVVLEAEVPGEAGRNEARILSSAEARERAPDVPA